MAPIELDGDTLGQKQRSFNALVKTAATDKSYKLNKIHYECSDVENLLMIHVACIRRSVEFVLEVLQCEDILYVNHVLRGSTWLVTDSKYIHIINPEYLNEELFPWMTKKAKNRMLTLIRNNLKDTARAETFFNYYLDDISLAQYWLPNCSLDLIENIVDKHADDISFGVMKHICRKFPKVLKIYLRSHSRDSYSLHKYILKAEKEDVIDMLDSIFSANQRVPKFGKGFTRTLMRLYPDVIIDNFDRYYQGIHLSTFVKHLKTEEVEKFLLLQIQRVSMKHNCRYEILKHYLRYVTELRRSQFIKTILSGEENASWPISASDLAGVKVALGFHIYEFVPFDYAFTELKSKLTEASSQSQRNSIIRVLIRSAKGDAQHLQSLLEYYQKQQIHNSKENKPDFFSELLFPNCIHKYDKKIWSLINNIFLNMYLNTDLSNESQKCLDIFIVYKILHDDHIPEESIKKINFKSFLECRDHLTAIEKQKVLNFVYNSCFINKYKKDVREEAEMRIMVDLLKSVLIFLRDWNQGPDDYPCVIDNIREIMKNRAENSWNIDLSSLYRMNKEFRKQLQHESLVLYPNDNTCLNALKYNPNQLSLYRDNIVAAVPFKRSLEKLRIYWPKSTVQQWVDTYVDHLQNPSSNKAHIIKSLCMLLPRAKIITILVNKDSLDALAFKDRVEYELLRKNTAKNLHIIRPSVDDKVLLMYSQKEYLPYLLPSFNTILRNQSSSEFWKTILMLLDDDVLRGYAARLTLSLLNKTKKLQGYNSVKIKLINKLNKLLFNDDNLIVALDIWNLFDRVFDDIPLHEQKKLARFPYRLPIPKKEVMSKYFMKIYSFMTEYYEKETADYLILNGATEFFNYLDLSIVEGVLLKLVLEHLTGSNPQEVEEIVSKYLLHCKSEKTQIERCEKVLIPLMNHYFVSWDNFYVSDYRPWYDKDRFYRILDRLAYECYYSITKFESIIPVKLFTFIRDKLEGTLKIKQDLYLVMTWNLCVSFMEILSANFEVDGNECIDDDKWNKICHGYVNSFGQASLNYIMPILLESSSYHVLVSKACVLVLSYFHIDSDFKLLYVKYLLTNVKDDIIYFVAIDVLRNLNFCNSDDGSVLGLLYQELLQIIRSHPSIGIRCYYNHYADVLLMKS